MADYSFSSSALRKSKIMALKEKKAMLEASTSSLRQREPSHPAHVLGSTSPTAMLPPNSPTIRSSNRTPFEKSNSIISLPEHEGAELQDCISTLNKSDGLPAMVSSSSSEDDNKERHQKATTETWLPQPPWKKPPTSKMSLGVSYGGDSSGDDTSGSMSDDSGVGGETIERYKGYLQQDNLAKRDGETLRSSPESSGDSPEKEYNTYDKYRSRLSKESSGAKWVAPKKKLGAPPSLEYNYRYSTSPQDVSEEVTLKEASSIPGTRPKLEKVTLTSKKIADDDLGILASMLGDEDSDGESGGGARDLFSASSSEYNQFIDGQSSDDDDYLGEELNPWVKRESAVTVTTPLASTPTMVQQSTLSAQDASSRTIEETNVGDMSEIETQIPETSIQPDRGQMPVAMQNERPTQWKIMKTEQVSNTSLSSSQAEESASSSLGPASSNRKRSFVLSEIAIPEHRVSDDSENLSDNKGHEIPGTSSHTEGDFSTLWNETVAAESIGQIPVAIHSERRTQWKGMKTEQVSNISLSSSLAGESASSSIGPASSRKRSFGLSDIAIPEHSVDDDPGSFPDTVGHGIPDTSNRTEGDFSTVWNETVAAESIASQGKGRDISFSTLPTTAEPPEKSHTIAEESHTVDSECNSSVQEEGSTELIPSTSLSISHRSIPKMIDFSSSSSDSGDGSLDFDMLAGLERLTVENSSEKAKLGNAADAPAPLISGETHPATSQVDSRNAARGEDQEELDHGHESEGSLTDVAFGSAGVISPEVEKDRAPSPSSTTKLSDSPPERKLDLSAGRVQGGADASEVSLDAFTFECKPASKETERGNADAEDTIRLGNATTDTTRNPDDSQRRNTALAESLKSWQMSLSTLTEGTNKLQKVAQKDDDGDNSDGDNSDGDNSDGDNSDGDNSDGSLDAFNFEATPPVLSPSKAVAPGDDDASMSAFSLDPVTSERSDSAYNIAEYKSQKNIVSLMAMESMNQGFQVFDTEILADLEAPTEEGSDATKSLNEGVKSPGTGIMGDSNKLNTETDQSDEGVKTASLKRRSIFSSGAPRHLGRLWATLLVLASVCLPIYFLVFFGEDSDGEVTSLDIFPTPPTLAPTLATTGSLDIFPTPPTLAPTLATTGSPTSAPYLEPLPEKPTTPTGPPPSTSVPSINPTTVPPTPVTDCDRICLLQEFLVSVEPNLEEDFLDFDTPQYSSLDWLVSNTNYDSYSDDQLIQRFALATVYFSTAGDQWRNNYLWLSDRDECLWYSGSNEATCDDNGSFIRLSLDLNNLSGTIPSEIVLLSNLIEIDFSESGSQGSLSGGIPTELGLLPKLTSLSLRGNALGSTIPSTLGNCTEIVNLDLSQTKLAGSIPSEVSGMTNLQFLSLATNNINGTLPSTIGAWTNLQRLELQRNAIGGALPTEIGDLSLLTSIDMQQNRLTRIPNQLGNLLLLGKMSFANNRLDGTIPSRIGSLSKLLSLELQGNSFTGTIPTALGNLIELRDTLDLSNNSLSGSIPSELGRLTFLSKMLLHDNTLTGEVPNSFSDLLRLSILRLESNNLEGIVPDSVCDVFSQTFPIFVSDCSQPEIECSCCTYCCQDAGECTCQYAGTEFDFLCAEFSRSERL